MKPLILVIVAIAVIVLAPFLTIWSLNTLFPVLAIPYGIDTWLATLVLSGVVGGTTAVSFRK